VAIQAVLFDLDETLWRLEAPPDWDLITAHQSAALSTEFARLGLDHLDLAAFVRRIWATFDDSLPNPDAVPDAPLAELRWRKGPAIIRRTLAEYGIACAAGDGECVWEALHTVPLRHFNIRLVSDAVSTVAALNAARYRLAIVTARPLPAKIVCRELQYRTRAYPTSSRRS
jgi:phosphoglycolate phosphatase-like HAD superfamily hydrolase